MLAYYNNRVPPIHDQDVSTRDHLVQEALQLGFSCIDYIKSSSRISIGCYN